MGAAAAGGAVGRGAWAVGAEVGFGDAFAAPDVAWGAAVAFVDDEPSALDGEALACESVASAAA